jgi:multiple sugar transport system substrate-binding protein
MKIRNICFPGVLAVGAALLSLSGCKGKGTAEDTSKVTLRLWATPNTSRPKEDLERVIERFKASHPGIDVQVEILDWGAAWTKITTAATSGAGPDVVQLGTSWTASITDIGSLLSVNDVLAQAKNEAGNDSPFVRAAYTYMKPLYADSVTSLPWLVDVRPIFYRRDVWQKAGADPKAAASWAGYLAALEKIKASNVVIEGQKVEAIGMAGKNDFNVVHNIYPWIIGNGGGIINETGDSVLLDNEKSIQGVLTYLRLIRSNLSPRAYLEKSSAQVSAEFDQGRIATWQESSTKLVYLERPAEQGGAANTIAARNFGTMLPPVGPAGRRLFVGGSQLAIFKSTQHPKEAKELLKYLTTDTGAVLEYCKLSGMAPALRRVFDSPYYSSDENRRLFKELADYGVPYPAVPYWGELETSILSVRFGNIIDIASEVNGKYDEAKVREELKTAATQIRELIKSQLEKKPQYQAKLQALKAAH